MSYKVLRPVRILQQPLLLNTDIPSYVMDFTLDDLQSSKQIWKQYASRKSMIDFLSHEYLLEKLEYFRVYRARGKTSSRRIPYTSVKNDIIRFAAGIRVQQRLLTQGLLNGSLPAQDWYQQTLFLTKTSLRAAFTIAEGGYHTFQASEQIERWLGMVLPVFSSFNNKAEQLKSGQRELNGRLLVEADALADSIVTTFENFRLNWAIQHGVRQGRRRIYGGETCHDSHDRKGCVELAARGYQPVWKIVPIGMAACYHRCRCYIEYRWESSNE